MHIIIIYSSQNLLEMEEAVLDVFDAIQEQFGWGGVEQVLKRITLRLATDDRAKVARGPAEASPSN